MKSLNHILPAATHMMPRRLWLRQSSPPMTLQQQMQTEAAPFLSSSPITQQKHQIEPVSPAHFTLSSNNTAAVTDRARSPACCRINGHTHTHTHICRSCWNITGARLLLLYIVYISLLEHLVQHGVTVAASPRRSEARNVKR